MIVRFSMDEIKNMDLLYTWTEINSEELGTGTEEHYHGETYCKTIISDVMGATLNVEWIEENYLGSRERIANEVFELLSSEGLKYRISFSINSYERSVARLECSIVCQNTAEYNHDLEELKIALKDRLCVDWKECTWLEDTQSVELCREAYAYIVVTENNLRALVSKILIHFLGVNWLKSAGMEKEAKSVEFLKNKFISRVSEFGNINTDFLSMTLETLVGVMLKGIIYEDNIILENTDYLQIQEMGEKNINGMHIANFVKGKRKIDKDIWNDLFVPYIFNPDDFKQTVHSFIEDRNHVAHSKVLSWTAYQVIKKDIKKMDESIESTCEKYEQEVASDELIETWIIENEEEKGEREFMRNYYRDRLSSETGMDILNESDIIRWFDETIHKLYNDVFQRYHFDMDFNISGFKSINEDSICFSVSSLAVEDGSAIITIETETTIDDELCGDSECIIKAKNSDGVVLFGSVIRFHNGSGCEGEDGLMEVSSTTEYDANELDGFSESLFRYIDEELNPYPAMLKVLVYESKGAESFVADFPCGQCGKQGVSINDSFLKIGRCCYCGWENEIGECQRCGELLDVDSLENGFCPHCSSYIEKQ